MKTLMKYFIIVVFLIVIFAPFNSLGAKSNFYTGTTLTPEEIEYLTTAYKDEAKCQYFFKKVMEKFPEAGFAKIMNSEQNHVSTLETVFNKYEIVIPSNLDFSAVTVPSSVDEACSMGLKFEQDNVEMYKNFLKNVTNNFLKTVFEDLRDITIYRNIPAVEKCK